MKKAATGGSGFSNSYSLSFTQRSPLQDFPTSYNTYCTLLDSFSCFVKANITTEKDRKQIFFIFFSKIRSTIKTPAWNWDRELTCLIGDSLFSILISTNHKIY